MSTEHQQYSTCNQLGAIRDYAERNDIQILQTYSDEGKSGMQLRGRAGLQALLASVLSETCPFNCILVYDVSRWGRFQDADESAYYEFICRRAGADVVYCAELFLHDQSPMSTLIKGLKRAMAGEYSRELSSKVFTGQCRLVQMGYWQGHRAGLGLRRLLLDQDGRPKGELQDGQSKAIQSDHVILIPGPADEIHIVGCIFDWFAHEKLSIRAIVRRLESHHMPSGLDRPWTHTMVHGILTNEKYKGDNVYNKTSGKLGQARTRNRPGGWIKKPSAFTPVVSAELFEEAQTTVQNRPCHLSNPKLIEYLTKLYRQYGFLTRLIIDQTPGGPKSHTYVQRFGSMLAAYKAAGYTPVRNYKYVNSNHAARKELSIVFAELRHAAALLGIAVTLNEDTGELTVEQELKIWITVIPCLRRQLGHPIWRVRLPSHRAPDLIAVVRMDPTNTSILDRFLLPASFFTRRLLTIEGLDVFAFESLRFEQMAFLLRLAERRTLWRPL